MGWAALFRRPPILRGVSAPHIRADHAVNQALINARYGPALPSSPQLRGEADAAHHSAVISHQASASAFAGADLLASPLPSMSASIFRAREAGTRAFMMRFSRPGTILERFLSRPLRPSDTHCSTLIGFIGMVFGSKPNFSSTAVFVNPAASTVT